MKEKGFFEKAFDDMKENAKKQKKIDKENFDEIKADSKERFEKAKKVDSDFQEFKNAKGIKEKAKVVVSHIERDGKKVAEENRENHKKMHGPINWEIIVTFIIGIIGALIMGFGMSKIMVGKPSNVDMLIGIITGVLGLIICVLNYPIYTHINDAKK